MFFLRIKIYKEGFEKIDKNSKMLIVSNHQSNLDPLMLIAAFGNINLTFIMKESILKVPVIGRCLYSAGFLPLDRKNNRKGLETIVKSIKRVQDGFPIGVFPEGTRSKGPNMGRLHDGTFKIATRAASSIVVCIIDNTYSNKKRFPFRRTKILIKVCEVLKYDDFKESTTKEIAENVTEIMMTSLQDARSRYKWLNETINKKVIQMNKIFNKRTLIIFIIEMMMTVIYLFIKGFDTIVNYCNAFFVSGFAIICIGGLSWLSNIGTFDIFGYSWKTLKSSFSKDVKRDYNSMYEYSESKRA